MTRPAKSEGTRDAQRLARRLATFLGPRPAEVQRIDFTRVKCPACGEAFVPSKGKLEADPS